MKIGFSQVATDNTLYLMMILLYVDRQLRKSSEFRHFPSPCNLTLLIKSEIFTNNQSPFLNNVSQVTKQFLGLTFTNLIIFLIENNIFMKEIVEFKCRTQERRNYKVFLYFEAWLNSVIPWPETPHVPTPTFPSLLSGVLNILFLTNPRFPNALELKFNHLPFSFSFPSTKSFILSIFFFFFSFRYSWNMKQN